MKKFSVCHLSKFYKPYSGGIESVVADIAEGSYFCSASVVAADNAGLRPRETIKSVKIMRSKEYINIAKVSIAPGYILDVLRESDGKILHVHLPNPLATLALIIANICGKDLSKIVVHWHSDIVKQRYLKLLFWPFQSWLLSKAKKILVTSQAYLDSSIALSNYVDKCVVVPIGISSLCGEINTRLVQDLRDKYLGKKIVFTLGRHVYYKGFNDLIAAANDVDDAIFLIGGSGPDTESYRSQIEELGLRDKIFLIGRVSDEDLPSFYAAADIFCLPSNEKSEAFGVVQLEAMSVGTPVISANIDGSGVPWVNTHMESGLTFEPHNIESLTNNINSLINDSVLRHDLSIGAKNRFEKYFTKEKSIEAIHDVYTEILKD